MESEAIAAARRAVALAPEDPAARLELADALLAVFPRRMRARAEAFAEIDQAELLGVDARDLADRRAAPKSAVYTIVVPALFWLCLAVMHTAGDVAQALAAAGMIMIALATVVVRLWHRGRTLREVLAVKRELSRRRLPTDAQVARRAPAATAALVVLVLPASALSIPGADGNAPSRLLARLLFGCVLLVGVGAWVAVDRWFRPGTVSRVLRHDAYAATAVLITFTLATATPVMVFDSVRRPGLWFALFLVQFGWMVGGGAAGAVLTSRRKRAES